MNKIEEVFAILDTLKKEDLQKVAEYIEARNIKRINERLKLLASMYENKTIDINEYLEAHLETLSNSPEDTTSDSLIHTKPIDIMDVIIRSKEYHFGAFRGKEFHLLDECCYSLLFDDECLYPDLIAAIREEDSKYRYVPDDKIRGLIIESILDLISQRYTSFVFDW